MPEGGQREQLQHVDRRQGDDRRSRREAAGPRDLRKLQADAARSGPARAGRLQAIRDADLSDSARRRAAREDHVLPGARHRPRLGDLRLSAGDGVAAGHRSADEGAICRHTRREERGADRGDGEPVARRRIRDRQARRQLLAGQPGKPGRLARPRRRAGFHCERPTTGIDVITSKTGRRDGCTSALAHRRQGAGGAEPGHGLRVRARRLRQHGQRRQAAAVAASRCAASSSRSGPDDRFEVITFNVAPNTLFNESRPANEENMKQAVAFLESQQALGGTVLRPALDTAYRYQDPDRTLNVVILSDGMTEQAEQSELVRLIRQRPSGSRVFLHRRRQRGEPSAARAVGERGRRTGGVHFAGRRLRAPGRGLSPQADAAGGEQPAADVCRRRRVRRRTAAAAESLSRRAAAHVRAVSTRRASTERDRSKATCKGSRSSSRSRLELPAADDANPEIERMWAWQRVDQLLAAARERGETGSVVDEIVRLCEDYSIASEYASFIVLENDAEYQRWKIDRKNLSRLERDRAAQAARAGTARRATQRGVVEAGPVERMGSANGGRRHRGQPGQPLDSGDCGQSRGSRHAGGASHAQSRANRGFDLDLPTDGRRRRAIDPISAAIGLGLAGASALAARRRKASRKADQA